MQPEYLEQIRLWADVNADAEEAVIAPQAVAALLGHIDHLHAASPILYRIRPFVFAVAVALEETLRRNDHKGEFYALTEAELRDLLAEERRELDDEFDRANPFRTQSEAMDEVAAASFAWAWAGGTNLVAKRGQQALGGAA